MRSSAFISLNSLAALALTAIALSGAPQTADAAPGRSAVGRDGVVRVKSIYGHEETIARLRQDVEGKGIRFFQLVEQSKLASAAGVNLRPSSLLIFGNPALGSQFITANPVAGLDWPVRVLVYTDAKGHVWTAYTDFNWIAKRHRIRNRTAAFNMASAVIGSITSAATARPLTIEAAAARQSRTR